MGLLAGTLARIDALGAAAYLESTNPANNGRYHSAAARAWQLCPAMRHPVPAGERVQAAAADAADRHRAGFLRADPPAERVLLWRAGMVRITAMRSTLAPISEPACPNPAASIPVSVTTPNLLTGSCPGSVEPGVLLPHLAGVIAGEVAEAAGLLLVPARARAATAACPGDGAGAGPGPWPV